jgi:hypothetical protein
MKENPAVFTMKEERNKLFLTFRGVDSIDDTLERLNHIPLTE